MTILARFCLPIVLAATIAGCGGAKNSDYIPKAESARDALTAALDLWKSGKPLPEKIPGKANPSVQVQDRTWASGGKLKDYQIMDEITAEGGHKQFAVRLTMAGDDSDSSKEELVSYIVFGKDPLWVMPEAEYNKMSGM